MSALAGEVVDIKHSWGKGVECHVSVFQRLGGWWCTTILMVGANPSPNQGVT